MGIVNPKETVPTSRERDTMLNGEWHQESIPTCRNWKKESLNRKWCWVGVYTAGLQRILCVGLSKGVEWDVDHGGL
jgi:hypothetical protein